MKTIETNNYTEPSISTIEIQLEGNLLQKTSDDSGNSGSTGENWPEIGL